MPVAFLIIKQIRFHMVIMNGNSEALLQNHHDLVCTSYACLLKWYCFCYDVMLPLLPWISCKLFSGNIKRTKICKSSLWDQYEYHLMVKTTFFSDHSFLSFFHFYFKTGFVLVPRLALMSMFNCIPSNKELLKSSGLMF